MKKRNILFLIAALLLSSFMILQFGCKKDKDEEQPPVDNNEVIISQNTVVVDTTVLTDLTIEGNTFSYNFTGGTPDIEVGDILVGKDNGGYIRKVASVNIDGNEIQIQTEDAKIVDAVLNGDFQQNLQIQISSKKAGNILNETYLVSAAKGVTVKGNVIDLDGVILYDGNIGGVDVELTLPEGSVSFEPYIDFGFKIRNGAFKELHAYAEGNLDMDFKAAVEANGEFTAEDEINLATFQTVAIQFIGIVPIVEVFTLRFDAGFAANNEIYGEVETGFNSDYAIKYGYQYTKDNGWEQIWEKSYDFTPLAVQGLFNADLNLEVYIKPSLTIEFYGVVGPGMDVRPYLDFTAEAHTKDIYWNWELVGGIDGHLLFNAHIFGWQIINYSHELFDWNKLIASDNGVISGNQPPTAIFTVDPTSGTTSTVFEFDGSGSYDNEDPTSNLQVRWDWENNGSWDTGWDYDKTETHWYGSEGTYTVKMEVKDTEGLTDYTTHTVTVNNGGGSTFTDPRDGQVYNIVTIGSQIWFAENLNYQTSNSWWYNNSSANGDVYGRLYTWDAALTACPAGWHLPSDDEWKTLEMFLGMSQSQANQTGWRGTDEGGKMKETGTTHWNSPNTGATNSSGFTALPGGNRSSIGGSFYHLGRSGDWWSSTESSGTGAWHRGLDYDYGQVYRSSSLKAYGFSVRCLKN